MRNKRTSTEYVVNNPKELGQPGSYRAQLRDGRPHPFAHYLDPAEQASREDWHVQNDARLAAQRAEMDAKSDRNAA